MHMKPRIFEVHNSYATIGISSPKGCLSRQVRLRKCLRPALMSHPLPDVTLLDWDRSNEQTEADSNDKSLILKMTPMEREWIYTYEKA